MAKSLQSSGMPACIYYKQLNGFASGIYASWYLCIAPRRLSLLGCMAAAADCLKLCNLFAANVMLLSAIC